MSAFPDIAAHRRLFVRMLPLPPVQVVQVAAERDRCALHSGNGNPIVDGCRALTAHARLDELWRNKSMPGNPPVSALINARRIDRANGTARASVPVLAIGPMVSQHGDATNLAEWGLCLIRLRISPNAAIAAIEPAGPAIIRATIWHCAASSANVRVMRPALYQKSDCGGKRIPCNLLPRGKTCYIPEIPCGF